MWCEVEKSYESVCQRYLSSHGIFESGDIRAIKKRMSQPRKTTATYKRKKLDVYMICTNFLIVGSSCGRIPDKQRVPPGVVKLHKVAANMLRGPCMDAIVGTAICELNTEICVVMLVE